MFASKVQIGAWATLDQDAPITYIASAHSDEIEFTLGGRDGFGLSMSSASVERCIDVFSRALAEHRAGCPVACPVGD